MAHLLSCSLNIQKSLCREPTHTCKTTRPCLGSWTKASHRRKISEDSVVQSYSTSTSLSTAAAAAAKEVCIKDGINANKEETFKYLVGEFGWKVRRLAEDAHEMRAVAQIQAEAFHAPMAFFDDLFFEFFKVEVLSGLLYKLRNSPPDRYACLVAEPAAHDSSKSQTKLVGVVDATALRDEAVLQHLTGANEYLYISGIAVSKCFRRQKIGSVLLKACDVLSILWGFDYLALRAYEDDLGARKLYTNAGYKVVSSDPPWMAWIGRKRRVLMIKCSNFISK